MTLKLSYRSILIALVLLLCNTACVQMPDIERKQASLINAYSDIDMRMSLAAKFNDNACSEELCAVMNSAFEMQVQRLGERLAATAYKLHPGLDKRIAAFTFSVADKKEAGMASNGAGKIVVFRGIQYLGLSDDAISFILAREMGHVIGRHHNRNTSIKLLFSALASVLFPAASLLGVSNLAAEASTTIVTSAASTATSFISSEVTISKIKPKQLIESDNIAIALLENLGWNKRSVASRLQFENLDQNIWLRDLHTTVQYLNNQIAKADADEFNRVTQAPPMVALP